MSTAYATTPRSESLEVIESSIADFRATNDHFRMIDAMEPLAAAAQEGFEHRISDDAFGSLVMVYRDGRPAVQPADQYSHEPTNAFQPVFDVPAELHAVRGLAESGDAATVQEDMIRLSAEATIQLALIQEETGQAGSLISAYLLSHAARGQNTFPRISKHFISMAAANAISALHGKGGWDQKRMAAELYELMRGQMKVRDMMSLPISMHSRPGRQRLLAVE